MITSIIATLTLLAVGFAYKNKFSIMKKARRKIGANKSE